MELWRRWRRLPTPEEEYFPSRSEGLLTAFAIFAGRQERLLTDIAQAFVHKDDGGGWSRS